MGGSVFLGSDPPVTLGPRPGLEGSSLTWSCSLPHTMHLRLAGPCLAQKQLIWEEEGASPRRMHRHLLPVCEVSPKMVLRKCRGPHTPTRSYWPLSPA